MNAIVNIPATHAGAVLAFTVTNSKGETVTKVANTHVEAVSAPKAVRLQAAQAADLRALVNGQYKPFTQAVRDALSKAHQNALNARPDFSLNPTNKAGVVCFLRAVSDVWAQDAAAKMAAGKKVSAKLAAIAMVMDAFIAHIDTQDAARTVDAEQDAAQAAAAALQQDGAAAPALTADADAALQAGVVVQ